MRLYEEVFIVKPDATDEEATGVVDQLSKTVTDQGGTVDKVDPWGRRKLAYRVLKYDEGNFFIVTFSAEAPTVREVERRLRVNDLVIKFLTVRLDEKLKWVEKWKRRREKRALRKPTATVVPAVPGIVFPASPAGGPAPGRPTPAPAAPETAPVESNQGDQ